MQKVVSELLNTFTSSWFYRDICVKLPTPFDNPAFSFLLTALVLAIVMVSAKEFVLGVIWRLRHVRQTERLKAERAENDRRMEEREQQMLDYLSAFAKNGVKVPESVDATEIEDVPDAEDAYEWPLGDVEEVEDAPEPYDLMPAKELTVEISEETPETEKPAVDADALLKEKAAELTKAPKNEGFDNEFLRIISGLKEQEEQEKIAREMNEETERIKAANLAKLESKTKSAYRVESGAVERGVDI